MISVVFVISSALEYQNYIEKYVNLLANQTTNLVNRNCLLTNQETVYLIFKARLHLQKPRAHELLLVLHLFIYLSLTRPDSPRGVSSSFCFL